MIVPSPLRRFPAGVARTRSVFLDVAGAGEYSIFIRTADDNSRRRAPFGVSAYCAPLFQRGERKVNNFYFCLTKSSTHVCVFSDVARSHAIGSGSATGRSSNALLLRMPAGVARGTGTRSVFFRHSPVIAKVTGSASGGNSKTAATSKVSGHGPPKNHRVFAKSSNFSPSPPPLFWFHILSSCTG